MCLELKSTAILHTAEKDIICYKRLRQRPDLDRSKPLHGVSFTGVIYDRRCEGKISVETDSIYFCTNDHYLDGDRCDDTLGYKYSWVMDNKVTSVIIDGKEKLGKSYRTPYQNFPIKLGILYQDKLNRKGDRVYKGFHSFVKEQSAMYDGGGVIARCIIPKGSEYYIGTFNGDESYASNQIIVEEIIASI